MTPVNIVCAKLSEKTFFLPSHGKPTDYPAALGERFCVAAQLPATSLTKSHRRQARVTSTDHSKRIGRSCGVTLHRGHTHCAACAVLVSKERFVEVARQGRVASHSREAETSRAETQRRHTAAIRAWQPSELPEGLNEEAYRKKIQPRLAERTVPAIATALGVSEPYAKDIRAGRCRPHPRHWLALARLIPISPAAQ